MLRREFFGVAAAGVASGVPPPVICRPGIDALIKDIEAAILADIPGVTKVQITFDPEDRNVPLMILAFRV